MCIMWYMQVCVCMSAGALGPRGIGSPWSPRADITEDAKLPDTVPGMELGSSGSSEIAQVPQRAGLCLFSSLMHL